MKQNIYIYKPHISIYTATSKRKSTIQEKTTCHVVKSSEDKEREEMETILLLS